MPQRTSRKKVLKLFEAGEFDVCTLFYRRFKSVIAQIPTGAAAHPASEVAAPAAKRRRSGGAIYEYEPDEGEILADLLPRNIAVQIFRALLENNASFYGAQMSAMDSATRNAGDMIKQADADLQPDQRQAQITKELIEIISGAEAL
jgi:F-type H+-transporting ATPase subunit gamma